ncbi:MAG: hypothetical protein K8R53_06225 [Bacteroidales bacterium]|nr:hypothetical protein [Bacteroidales bacterium]
MKKINKYKSFRNLWVTITFALLISFPFGSFAQDVELTPFAGYQFGGSIRFYEGKMKIKDAANYGLMMDIGLTESKKIELYYSYMDTKTTFSPYYGFDLDYSEFETTVQYFQVGAVHEHDMDNIKPFGAFTLGATWFQPKNSLISDVWQFSVTLGGGVKIWLTDVVGIRLQGRLLMPMYFAGGGLFCGIGTGGSSCGVSVGTGSTILQGDFTGGLIIGLGK